MPKLLSAIQEPSNLMGAIWTLSSLKAIVKVITILIVIIRTLIVIFFNFSSF